MYEHFKKKKNATEIFIFPQFASYLEIHKKKEEKKKINPICLRFCGPRNIIVQLDIQKLN